MDYERHSKQFITGIYLKPNIPGGKQLHGQRRQTNETGESFQQIVWRQKAAQEKEKIRTEGKIKSESDLILPNDKPRGWNGAAGNLKLWRAFSHGSRQSTSHSAQGL